MCGGQCRSKLMDDFLSLSRRPSPDGFASLLHHFLVYWRNCWVFKLYQCAIDDFPDVIPGCQFLAICLSVVNNFVNPLTNYRAVPAEKPASAIRNAISCGCGRHDFTPF